MLKPLLDFVKKIIQPTASAKPVEATPSTPPQAANKPKPQRPRAEKPAKPPAPRWEIEEFQVPPADGKTRFHDLNLHVTVMHAIADLGFQYCSPIQAQILPHTLAGKDAIGRAQTGTGKTAAFLVTLITLLGRNRVDPKRPNGQPRALVLAPTRELVLQIAEEAETLCKYSRVTCAAVYGGMDYNKQQQMLQKQPIDILIATPGRLLDFERQQDVQLGKVEILVLDEADRMLDMGFIPDVRRIVYSTPKKHQRQTLFFSATFTEEVKRLAEQWTKDPVTVEIEVENVAAKSVEQIVYITTIEQKYALLYNLLEKDSLQRVIVFTNRRNETRKLTDRLRANGISAAMLSGDVPQIKRVKTLENFKESRFRVLVATDVAGRGLHVDNISHVFNYNLPMDAEDYVHRIGRTGRAGLAGISISFACEEDSFQLPDIEEFVGHPLNYLHPDDSLIADPPAPQKITPSEHKPREHHAGDNNSPHNRGPRRGPRRRNDGGQRGGGGNKA